uniref:MBD domain-containing protein n=1 Tax=Oryza punctata TaxID=4537 RepID=A0A0E0KPN2_ORYPU
MSSEAPKSIALMSNSGYDSDETLTDNPFVGIDADSEDEENTSAMTLLLGNQPLDVAPLNAIPFNRVQALSRKVVSGKEEVSIPHWLKVHKLYEDGDWKASISIRANGHKDWFYNHREYKKTFRSKPEVELFMERTLLNGTNIFNGRKLHKKRTMDSYGEGSGGNKSSMGKKNTNIKTQKPSSIGDDPMMLKPTLPHGFV